MFGNIYELPATASQAPQRTIKNNISEYDNFFLCILVFFKSDKICPVWKPRSIVLFDDATGVCCFRGIFPRFIKALAASKHSPPNTWLRLDIFIPYALQKPAKVERVRRAHFYLARPACINRHPSHVPH